MTSNEKNEKPTSLSLNATSSKGQIGLVEIVKTIAFIGFVLIFIGFIGVLSDLITGHRLARSVGLHIIGVLLIYIEIAYEGIYKNEGMGGDFDHIWEVGLGLGGYIAGVAVVLAGISLFRGTGNLVMILLALAVGSVVVGVAGSLVVAVGSVVIQVLVNIVVEIVVHIPSPIKRLATNDLSVLVWPLNAVRKRLKGIRTTAKTTGETIDDFSTGSTELEDAFADKNSSNATDQRGGGTEELSTSDREERIDVTPEEKTVADEFADACDSVTRAEVVNTNGPVHIYIGHLTEDIGEGHIYALASDHADDESVCTAFSRAADQWQGIGHNPHIADVVESGEDPRPWVAIDTGTSLDNLDFTPDKRLKIVQDISEALRTGRLYNLTHGALRPNAICLTTDESDHPMATVADWGVTRGVWEALNDQPVTPYTAPEQLDAPGTATRSTDIYRLGAVAYHMLTGKPPIDPETSDLETLTATICEGTITPASGVADLPDKVDKIFERAMATDPADRYDYAYDFRDDLTAVFK